MPKVQLKKVAILSAAVLVVQILLSKFVYPLLQKSTTTLFAIGPYSDINPTSGIGGQAVGNKVLGYLTGYIPFDIANISVYIAMFIGVFVLIFAGMWLYDTSFVRSNLYTGKNLSGRIFAILLYGHAVLYLVLLLMKWSVPNIALNLLIGLGINLILVSTLVAFSAAKLNFPRI